MAVTCSHLSFTFREEKVLHNLSFQIEKGEFIGMIGPNGGGKTTLLKLIMGLLPPLSGKLTLFGKNPEEAYQEVGYVPQNQSYDPAFPISVKEVVLSPFAKHALFRYPKIYHEKAHAALEALDLLPYQNEPFGDLSGGLMQRTLIARAIADDPNLLLLDEPTSNVDPQTRQKIYDFLLSLKGKKTIIMVTHDLNTAIEHVDRVFCVEKELTILLPSEVCKHFTFGLYHTPLRRGS